MLPICWTEKSCLLAVLLISLSGHYQTYFFGVMWIAQMKFVSMPRSPIRPHKRKNAKAARSAPEGVSLAFLKRCGIGEKRGKRKFLLKNAKNTFFPVTPHFSYLPYSIHQGFFLQDCCVVFVDYKNLSIFQFLFWLPGHFRTHVCIFLHILRNAKGVQ